MPDEALLFENLFDDGKNFWFTDFTCNALFQLDKTDWTVKLAGCFPKETFSQKSLYSSTAMCGGKMYFIPHMADEIVEYDPAKSTFKKISVDAPSKDNHMSGKWGKFFDSIVVGDVIYLIPDKYPGLLCYDTVTGQFSCFDNWVDEIENKRVAKRPYFITCTLQDNRLVLPCACADAVVIFNVETHTSQVIRTPDTDYPYKYCGICFADDYYYLLSADATLTKRKLESDEEPLHTMKLPATGQNIIEFFPACFANGYLYFFPQNKNHGWKLCIETGELAPEELLDSEREFETQQFSFLTSWTDNGKVYAMAGNSRRLIEYNFANRYRREAKLFPSREDRKSLLKILQATLEREPFSESGVVSLDLFLDAISIQGSSPETTAETIGAEIYHALTSE